jgi:4-carboxymuconolactone decarboxylase
VTPSPDSAARLDKLAVEDLDADQRAVYDAIAGGPRARGPQLFRLVDERGSLEGPFNAFLLQPRLGNALQALGAAVRYETALSDRHRELAVLVVAAGWDSDYEWYAHAPLARQAGLTEEELGALWTGRIDGLADDTDRLLASTTETLVSRGDLDDDEYARAVAAFGRAGLFELLTLVGYYATLALQLRVFRVPAPDGA